MRLNKIFLMVSFILLSSGSCFADVSVPYGEGAGKVDYINSNKYVELEEPLPSGPLTFRIVDNKIWVADSVGGKLMQFDNKGKLISEFSILPDGIKPYVIDEDGFPLSNILIDDIAPVLGQYGDLKAWWIVDSGNNRLLKFSADGKPLALLQDQDFGQLYRVEVGTGGHLFVADKGNNVIYVYDSEGNLLSEQNWEGSGMSVAGKEDNLYRLIYFNEEKRYMLVTTDVEGKVIKAKALDVEMLNPELLWVDEVKEEAVITYTPKTGLEDDLDNEDLEDIAVAQLTSPEGGNSKESSEELEELKETENKEDPEVAEVSEVSDSEEDSEDSEDSEESEDSANPEDTEDTDVEEVAENIEDTKVTQPADLNRDYEIIRVGFDGNVKASGKLSAPFSMNRFIEHANYEDVYIGKCNYMEAPKGNFEIIPFEMPQ